MNSFRFLEHTADIGIEATAARREGLAEQSGLGLRHLLFGACEAEPVRSAPVVAEGGSAEECLVNWLNELLYLMTGKGFVPAAIRVGRFSEHAIHAEVSGEPFDSAREFLGRPIHQQWADCPQADAYVITGLQDPLKIVNDIVSKVGDQERVLVPAVLGIDHGQIAAQRGA